MGAWRRSHAAGKARAASAAGRAPYDWPSMPVKFNFSYSRMAFSAAMYWSALQFVK